MKDTEKWCNCCKKIKPITEFSFIKSKTNPRRYATCIECLNNTTKKKKCKTCKEEKFLDEFPNCTDCVCARSNICKDCRRRTANMRYEDELPIIKESPREKKEPMPDILLQTYYSKDGTTPKQVEVKKVDKFDKIVYTDFGKYSICAFRVKFQKNKPFF